MPPISGILQWEIAHLHGGKPLGCARARRPRAIHLRAPLHLLGCCGVCSEEDEQGSVISNIFSYWSDEEPCRSTPARLLLFHHINYFFILNTLPSELISLQIPQKAPAPSTSWSTGGVFKVVPMPELGTEIKLFVVMQVRCLQLRIHDRYCHCQVREEPGRYGGLCHFSKFLLGCHLPRYSYLMPSLVPDSGQTSYQ